MSWLEVLQVRASRVPLGVIAKEIGYSKSTVSRVLNGSYGGDIEAVKHAVQQKYQSNLVECPLLGDIEREQCLHHQNRPFAATNPMRVQLHHACKTCPNKCEGESSCH
ncbi:transcriptional regulator [Vibrio paucivorans]